MTLSFIIARDVQMPKTGKRSRAAAYSLALVDIGDYANALLWKNDLYTF